MTDMTDEERLKVEWDAFYAQQNAEKIIAGIVLVAIILGLIVGTIDVLVGLPAWLEWIRP